MLPEGGSVIEFYAKSAEATALAQQTPAEDAPETFVKPYKGMLPEGGSVIDFLEVILSDFARLESATSSSEATEQEELEKAVAYYEKLKPTCVDSGITYEDRVKRREEEIQSLQEALRILAGEDFGEEEIQSLQ